MIFENIANKNNAGTKPAERIIFIMNKKVLSQFNEKTVAKVNEMTYMSDLFMSYALKDPEVLRHFIRTCLGDHSIELYSTATQQRFNNIKGKEIVFDSVSEDSKGNVVSVRRL